MSERSEDEDVKSSEEDIESDDSLFEFPFMGGEDPEGVFRLPEARQHFADGNHFGGERFMGNSRPFSGTLGLNSTRRDFWGTPQCEGNRQTYVSPVGWQPDADVVRRRERVSLKQNGKLGRFNAPAAFEKGIKQSEKYERWLKWKTTFDIALSICEGTPSDAQKTGLLHTYVGDEVRDIITMLSLPPMHGSRVYRHGDYTELSMGLNEYFRTLVDETTDFARYNARKQLQRESVHQYAMKLRDLALRVNVGHDSIAFRHQFLAGLANRQLAKKSTEDGTPLNEILRQAGRIEQSAEMEEEKPWQNSGNQMAGVSALSESKGWKENSQRAGFKRYASKGRDKQSKWKKCATCGRRSHDAGRVCPAAGKICLNCGRSDHFAVTCSRQTKMSVLRLVE